MAFEALSEVKRGYEAMRARMATIRAKSEKTIEQGFAVVEVNGGLLAWGYANERWGDLTSEGVKEHHLMGMPTDLLAGGALLGLGIFGGLGKYSEHGINLGNASTGAFTYRMGVQLAKKAATAQQTSGYSPHQVGSGAAPAYGGAVHHVEYAR